MTFFIDKLKQLTFFKLAVIYLRYLIGFAFIFASIIKIRGERFTSISLDEPIGYFFEAMYQTGFYWNFLGWSQFIAGSLLITQRFATLGAMVFMPIILNVFMITHSIDFGSGTPAMTTLMLMGTIFLIVWDYKKWMIFLRKDHQIKLDLTKEPEDSFMTHPVWIIVGILFTALTLASWLIPIKNILVLGVSLLATGIVPLIYMLIRHRRITAKNLEY